MSFLCSSSHSFVYSSCSRKNIELEVSDQPPARTRSSALNNGLTIKLRTIFFPKKIFHILFKFTRIIFCIRPWSRIKMFRFNGVIIYLTMSFNYFINDTLALGNTECGMGIQTNINNNNIKDTVAEGIRVCILRPALLWVRIRPEVGWYCLAMGSVLRHGCLVMDGNQ